jgi:hypothetical protein
MLKKLNPKTNLSSQVELKERIASSCSSDCFYWCRTANPNPYPGERQDILFTMTV